MKENEAFYFRLGSDLCSLQPCAVPPAGTLRVFFRSVLGICDKQVRAARMLLQDRIAFDGAMFEICGIDYDLSVALNPETAAPLRMPQRK